MKVVTEEETTLIALNDPPTGSGTSAQWSPTYGSLVNHGQPPQGSYAVPDDAWCLSQGNRHQDGSHWVKTYETDDRGRISCGCDLVSNTEVTLPNDGLLSTLNLKPATVQRNSVMEGGQFKAVAGYQDVLAVPGLVAPVKRVGTGQKKGRYSGTFQFEIQLRFAKPDGTNFIQPSDYLPEFERELDPIEVEQGCLVKVENPDGEHDVLHDRSVILSCGGQNQGQVLAPGLSLIDARGKVADAIFNATQNSNGSSLKLKVKFKPGQWQSNVLIPNPGGGDGNPSINPGQSYTLVSVMFSKGNLKSLPQFISIE